MKYVYVREDLKTLGYIGMIVGLPLLILSIYLMMNIREIGYCMLLTFIIFFIILFIFSITRLKWRKWHRNMQQLGSKFEGKIIEFGYMHKSGKIANDPPTADYEEYWLTVVYTDKEGKTKTFNTPALAFAPEERKDVTCDVYIYNDEIVATNFVNLNKKKTDWEELFYYLIIGVIFVGISLLIAWIQSR